MAKAYIFNLEKKSARKTLHGGHVAIPKHQNPNPDGEQGSCVIRKRESRPNGVKHVPD
jgi:hypothetical protein